MQYNVNAPDLQIFPLRSVYGKVMCKRKTSPSFIPHSQQFQSFAEFVLSAQTLD